MNYFINIPTFSRFYALADEDDEKPPPDLKSTDEEFEERKIEAERKQKKRTETKNKSSPAEETMGSVPRKERSLWSDWQFWKRNDGSGGPFGAFRKSTKSSTGAFTSRKDVNDSTWPSKAEIKTDQSKVPAEVVIRGSVHVSDLEKDDPLVSYKNESNGSKHVVINMAKVETLAEKKNDTTHQAKGEVVSGIMEEKNSRIGQAGNATWTSQSQPTVSPQPDSNTKTSKIPSDVKLAKVKVTTDEEETNGKLPNAAKRSGVEPSDDTNPVHAKDRGEISRSKNSKAARRQSNAALAKGSSLKKEHGETKSKENKSKTCENAAESAESVQSKNPPESVTASFPETVNGSEAKIKEEKRSNQQKDTSSATKINGANGSSSNGTIQNCVIPLPKLTAEQVAQRRQTDTTAATDSTGGKGPCLEQGRLHNVLKKVTETLKPGNSNSISTQSSPAQVPTERKASAKTVNAQGRKCPGIAKAVRSNQPEMHSLVTKKQPISFEDVPRQYDIVAAKMRANGPQKAVASSPRMQKVGKMQNVNIKAKKQPGKPLAQLLNGQEECKKYMNKATQTRVKMPVMKDAWTAAPTPPAAPAKVDALVQVPDYDDELEKSILDTTDVGFSLVDETASLLKKRPWDTERVLKMQVLLDEKQVAIGQLKDAGRKQREELRASKKRCTELEEIVSQANMEGKPQLVIQVNELTEIKNELLGEVTKLTVDIERERTTVKALKIELNELKGQLSAARKRSGNSTF